jgi:hypothetical protein
MVRKAPTKAVVRVPTPRPRNPLSLAARKRVAGAHGPSKKAERAAAKVRLRKRPDEG